MNDILNRFSIWQLFLRFSEEADDPTVALGRDPLPTHCFPSVSDDSPQKTQVCWCLLNILNISATTPISRRTSQYYYLNVSVSTPTAVTHHSDPLLLGIFCLLQCFLRFICIWSLNSGQLSRLHTPPEVWPWKYKEKLSFFFTCLWKSCACAANLSLHRTTEMLFSFWQKLFYLGWAQFGPLSWQLSTG